jgi:hypothetical protein
MSRPREVCHFFTKVVGVSHMNDDGSNRQEILTWCGRYEKLVLDHQEDNPNDPNAVRVCRDSGEQLGYLRADLAEEVVRLAGRGYLWLAYVSELSGGRADAPTRGVNLLLVRVAPGVSVSKAKQYIEEVVEPELRGNTRDGPVNDFSLAEPASKMDRQGKGCGAGLLLVVASGTLVWLAGLLVCAR